MLCARAQLADARARHTLGGMQPPSYGYPPAPGYAPPQEVTLHRDELVTVTSARAIVQGTTYAVANMTSVRMFTVKKSRTPIVYGILGLVVALLVGLGGSPWALIFAVAGGFGILFFFLLKDRHFVRIGTAGAEHDAIWSHDEAYIRRVVEALNNAVIHRGMGR